MEVYNYSELQNTTEKEVIINLKLLGFSNNEAVGLAKSIYTLCLDMEKYVGIPRDYAETIILLNAIRLRRKEWIGRKEVE